MVGRLYVLDRVRLDTDDVDAFLSRHGIRELIAT
jgi:hypothetical protein